MFHCVENRRLAKCLKHWAYSLFQVYKLRRENAKPENMCDIVFEKTKGRGGAVNRSSRPKGSFKKKCYEIFWRTH